MIIMIIIITMLIKKKNVLDNLTYLYHNNHIIKEMKYNCKKFVNIDNNKIKVLLNG